MAGKVRFSLRMDQGFDRVRKALEALRARGAYVRAGVLGAKANEDHGGLTNAKLAAIHEFGAPSRGIPERSFIRSTFNANREKYRAQLREVIGGVYRLQGGLEQGLGLIGARMAADMKRGITVGPGIPPPLKPETIARKGSSRPLVDTGQLVNSITWDVVLGGRS